MLFSSDLIPGVNGGYYTLQVRSVLETNQLSYSDFPLYFYLNAILLKLFSLFGILVNDRFIINFLKVIDSICLPLSLIPLVLFLKKTKSSLPFILDLLLLAYMSFSISPLILIGDLQKNAFGIPFLILFTGFLYSYLQEKDIKQLVFMIFTLLLIGLIHFGVFIVALALFVLNMIQNQSKKKFLWMALFLAMSFLMMFLFDTSRAYRVLFFWNVLFEKPLVLQGPVPVYDLLQILFSYGLVFFIFRKLKSENSFSKATQKMLMALALVMTIFAFPLLDIEYFRRFSLFLYIFHTLTLIFVYPVMKERLQRFILILLFLMLISSVISNSMNLKKDVMTKEMRLEIEEIQKSKILTYEDTLIITRHGLEWWISYFLRVRAVSDKGFKPDLIKKYRNLIFIHQTKNIPHFQGTEFKEPLIHPKSKLIMKTNHFDIYQFQY